MEVRGNESSTTEAVVKEEPSERASSRNSQQNQNSCSEEDSEQRIECTTESLECENRSCLSKCVFCDKLFGAEDEPKLLECLHAACSQCINSKLNDQSTSVDTDVLLESNVITCHVCNVTSQTENLIDNRFITKFLEDEFNNSPDDECKDTEEDKKCTSCHDNATATSWCVECEEFICQNCVMAHQRLKITKDHTIKPKEEVSNDHDNVKKIDKKSSGYLFCNFHTQEQLSLFCQTCDRLTCRDCQLTEHRDHKYKFIHEIAAETRSFVSTLLKEVSYKRVLLKSAMKVIEDRQVLIVEKKKNLVQEITQMVVQLTNAINTRGKQLVMRLNEVCDQKQNTLNEKKIALDQLSKLTDHCIQFVSYILDKGSDMELLYSKKSVTCHLQRIKSRRADIPNPEIPVRIHLSLDKVSDLIKVVSSIGGIVVDGRVYPSLSPSTASTASTSRSETPSEPMQIATSPLDASVTVTQPLAVTQQSSCAQQSSYNQVSYTLAQQQQPPSQGPPQQIQQTTSQTLQPPTYMQHYAMNVPSRSSPQTHMAKIPYNVNYSNRMQQPMMMQQRPIGACHQQQVTSSTHPHQQVHMDQNASLRGLLAHNVPPYRPMSNHNAYRMPPGYRYPPSNIQRSLPPHSYPPVTNPMVPTVRMQTRNPSPPSTQQMTYSMPPQQQQPTARWHIPQIINPLLPFYSTRQVTPTTQVSVNDAYKITLKNHQTNNNNPPKYNTNTNVNLDNALQSPNLATIGQAVSSSVPKTPSPVPPGKPDETEKSIDKFCQKSLNDLMLTIAKLDSNGIVVIPEAQRNQMENAQVDSSTDEALHSMTDNNDDTTKDTAASMTKDDPNEDWCAVCMDGGDAVLCCDKCPKVFHLYCHIPSLKSFPDESETWQCMLCTNVLDCSEDPPEDRQPNQMSRKNLRIAQRIVLELYCQYEQSLPFREVVSPEIAEYHKIIKQPMALEIIKGKLQPDSPSHYTDLKQVMADIRLMFKNAFTYNSVESQVYQEARNLEEFFEKLLLKWAPNFAYDDPFLSAERDDEEVFPPNKKYRRIISD